MTDTDDIPAAAQTPPPYLATPALRQRLDLLGHLLEFGHQIVVVQGEAGSGRSRLLGAVAEQAKPNCRVIPCDGRSVVTGAAMLDALTQALELADLNPGIEDLRARLAEIELGGQLCILALDDGEHLEDSARAMLFALAYSEHQRGDLRVVMTGDADSDFSESLQAAAPQGAVIHVVDLPRLEPEELKTLALSALPAVDGESALDDGLDLDRLAAAAEGNPGRMLASLQRGYRKPLSPGVRAAAAARAMGGALRGFNVRKYAAVLAAAAFVLVAVAVGMLLVWRHGENTRPGTVEITLPAPGSSAATSSAAEPAPPAADNDSQAGPAPAIEPPAEQVAATPAAAEPAPIATQSPRVEAPATVTQEITAPPPAPGIPVEAITPATANIPSAELPGKAAAPKPKRAVSASVTNKARASKHAPKPSASNGEQDHQDSYSAQWLKGQQAQSYVIQLFASRARDATTRFIRLHGLSDKAAVIAVKRNEAPWYVVVTGHYATRAAANSAIHTLPAPLAKEKPWPRAVATLK